MDIRARTSVIPCHDSDIVLTVAQCPSQITECEIVLLSELEGSLHYIPRGTLEFHNSA